MSKWIEFGKGVREISNYVNLEYKAALSICCYGEDKNGVPSIYALRLSYIDQCAEFEEFNTKEEAIARRDEIIAQTSESAPFFLKKLDETGTMMSHKDLESLYEVDETIHDFKWAINRLLEGKKIARESWISYEYYQIHDHTLKFGNERKVFSIVPIEDDELRATDWEVVE